MNFAIFVTSAVAMYLVLKATIEMRRDEIKFSTEAGLLAVSMFFASLFGLAYSIAQFAYWIATIAGAA